MKGRGRSARVAASAAPRSASAEAGSPATGVGADAAGVAGTLAAQRGGVSDELPLDESEYTDEVDNDFVRGRMENVARVATGGNVRVRFGKGCYTDLAGTVGLDPNDPSSKAPSEDRIVMMQGGLEHEVCHELYYDRGAFEDLKAQVEADPSRKPMAFINNILADGHDEWRHKLRRPEAYEIIEAHDALMVETNGSGRCSFDPEKQDTWTQVTWAMLYRALPYYRVPEEKLSPQAASIYREVAPHVDTAITGTSRDCLRQANEIFDILKGRDVVPDTPEQNHLGGGAGPGGANPGDGSGKPAAPGIGAGGGGAEDGELTDQEAAQVASANGGDGEAGAEGGGGAGDGSSEGESGSSFAASSGAGERALDNRRPGAATLAEGAKSRRPQDSSRSDPAERVRRTADALQEFRGRWGANRRLASEFAHRIEEARTETAAPKRRQSSGRLDRGRRRALASGEEQVFIRRGRSREVDMSVELLLDVSGSMREDIPALKDSTSVISRGLDEAKIDHEVRGFSGSGQNPLYRAFGEKADWKLGAIESKGSTHLHEGVGRVRAAFGPRSEKQKLAIVFTDGSPSGGASGIDRARAELAAARREGVAVLGVYLRPKLTADHSQEDVQRAQREEAEMRNLFGGKVAVLDDVSQLPRVAGKKIVDLLRKEAR